MCWRPWVKDACGALESEEGPAPQKKRGRDRGAIRPREKGRGPKCLPVVRSESGSAKWGSEADLASTGEAKPESEAQPSDHGSLGEKPESEAQPSNHESLGDKEGGGMMCCPSAASEMVDATRLNTLDVYSSLEFETIS